MSTIGQSATKPAELTTNQTIELTVAANQITANDAHVNAYQIRNALLLKRQKERVRYENGHTLPTTAEVLLANAERQDYNHRRTLSRNISKIDGKPRPAGVCAHHIVALTDQQAAPSRKRLFGWGIGINDGDNGVHLPMHKVGIAGYPNAAHHKPYHSPSYHIEVYFRLLEAGDTQSGRGRLREIKADLLTGSLSL